MTHADATPTTHIAEPQVYVGLVVGQTPGEIRVALAMQEGAARTFLTAGFQAYAGHLATFGHQELQAQITAAENVVHTTVR